MPRAWIMTIRINPEISISEKYNCHLRQMWSKVQMDGLVNQYIPHTSIKAGAYTLLTDKILTRAVCKTHMPPNGLSFAVAAIVWLC